MPLSTILAIAVSVSSVAAAMYTVFRVGFRVDILWEERSRTAKLEQQIADLQGYLYHRGEVEALVKHAIYSKEKTR